MNSSLARLVGAAVLLIAPASAALAAEPTIYTDEVTFVALGSIDQTTTFDAFSDTANTPLPTPYTDGDLSLYAADAVVYGRNHSFTMARNAFSSFDFESIAATVDANGYDMISFSIGGLLGDTSSVVEIFTTKGSYLLEVPVFDVENTFTYYGLAAGAGEYFTGLLFSSTAPFTGVAFSEFKLGHVDRAGGGMDPGCGRLACDPRPGVPEPGAWALMILGFGATGAAVRRRRGPGREQVRV